MYQATLRRTEEAVKALEGLGSTLPVVPASTRNLGLPHDCASKVVVEELTPEEGTLAPARIEPAAPAPLDQRAILQRQEQFVQAWNSMKQTGTPEEREAARERLKESMLGEPQ